MSALATARPVRQRRRRSPIANRPIPVLWTVSCCVCNRLGPAFKSDKSAAVLLRRFRFKLRKIGGLTGRICGSCSRSYDRLLPPETRGDCGKRRPCVRTLCRYHLIDDVSRKASKDFVLPETCCLDIVDAHPEGMTLKEAGKLLGQTREGARYTILNALTKLRAVPGLPFSFSDADDDNIRDAASKGRLVRLTGDLNGVRRHPGCMPSGANHWTRRRAQAVAHEEDGR